MLAELRIVLAVRMAGNADAVIRTSGNRIPRMRRRGATT